MKKMLSFLLVVVLLVSLSSTVYASADTEVRIINEYITHNADDSEVFVENENMVTISDRVRGTSKPTSTTSWGSGNKINYSGSAKPLHTVYSNGFFTGAEKVTFTFTNKLDSRIKITLWESTAIVNSTASRTIEGGDTLTFTVTGLDSNKKYYIASIGSTSFTGSATKIK